jgi:hypothetical protein
MPLVGLEPTSTSPEKQGFSAERGTVADAGKAGDSKEDRWRCFSIREVKDREFKPAIAMYSGQDDGVAHADFLGTMA